MQFVRSFFCFICRPCTKSKVEGGDQKLTNNQIAPANNDETEMSSNLDGTTATVNTDNCCYSTGIPFATPALACKGRRESVLFVTCANAAEPRRPDALVAVDVDPKSESFCQVLSKLDFDLNDEVHHTGWNACASCHGQSGVRRTHLIVPCLHSSRIYVVNCGDEKSLKLEKVPAVGTMGNSEVQFQIIEADELRRFNASCPHTSHCLADGTIMISTLGDNNGDNRGDFVLLDGKTFEVKGRWARDDFALDFHYDFWYQPRQNVLISTEWGSPNAIRAGFSLADVRKGLYGNKLHVWNWNERRHVQTIVLDETTGAVPLEVRFLHEPTKSHAFVGTALGSAVYHIHQTEENGDYEARLAAVVLPKSVEGWLLPEMPAMITDILIAMDDHYLYASCWFHGEIRQYDIRNPFDFKLTSQLTIGGLLHRQSGVAVLDENFVEHDQTEVKGRRIDGGPQMMQLSLDGKRLYVTTSLYTVWDQQFYPSLMKNGSVMLCVDVETENGTMQLNPDFLIDFGKLLDGPYAAHEMRYPDGDCTSDIWL